MIVGVVREIREQENRVGVVPSGVEAFRAHGHSVLVQRGAGGASGHEDARYQEAGATLLESAAQVWAGADLVVKVKEPQPSEYKLLRRKQMIFTYFHFAASREMTEAVLASGCVAIAYEGVTTPDGRLPLLAPMSEIAGRMAAQQAARFLERSQGGRGVLMGGVPGVEPATVVVVGGGSVGSQAARVAAGMGARVFILDTRLEILRNLAEWMPANVTPLMSDTEVLRRLLPRTDALISAVLRPGLRAPRILSREMVARMQPGSVVVDVAIDQGGSLETSRPTSHADPVFVEEGVLHYCVPNMPGGVPVTSTLALTNATLPWALQLADRGWARASLAEESLAKGVAVVNGGVSSPEVAQSFDLPWIAVIDLAREDVHGSTA
ncbi:MAG: alanine dehydrogenase [Magnetococcales bacterium]|nr:alanine dehydrogenase [Magnetococcales bacterium]